MHRGVTAMPEFLIFNNLIINTLLLFGNGMGEGWCLLVLGLHELDEVDHTAGVAILIIIPANLN
jgi:hypothetical protein